MFLVFVLTSLPLMLCQEQPTPVKPMALLIDPSPRTETSPGILDNPPCSGVAKDLAHTLAEPGDLHPVMWRVFHPSESSNCTIRLAPTSDFSKFVTLSPLNRISDSEGWFPCGREETNAERVTIQFPERWFCSECTLQWVWKTFQGAFYQCSDVRVFTKEANCKGMCQNGSKCIEGVCVCSKGFYGDFCELSEKEEEEFSAIGYFVTFVVFCLTCSCLASAVYFYFNQNKLPGPIYKFLEENCAWCIRRERILSNQPSREESKEQVSEPGKSSSSSEKG